MVTGVLYTWLRARVHVRLWAYGTCGYVATCASRCRRRSTVDPRSRHPIPPFGGRQRTSMACRMQELLMQLSSDQQIFSMVRWPVQPGGVTSPAGSSINGRAPSRPDGRRRAGTSRVPAAAAAATSRPLAAARRLGLVAARRSSAPRDRPPLHGPEATSSGRPTTTPPIPSAALPDLVAVLPAADAASSLPPPPPPSVVLLPDPYGPQ